MAYQTFYSKITSQNALGIFDISAFNYCNFIIDGAGENVKSKLQCQQNVASRAVCKADLSNPTNQLLNGTRVESIWVSMKKACCKIIYKGFYDLGPDSLNQMFQLYVPERVLSSEDELKH